LERIGTLLLNGVLHAVVDKAAEGRKHLKKMHNSQKFQKIYRLVFLQIEHGRKRGSNVEPEVEGEVSFADVFKGAIASVCGEKVENDFDGP